MKRSVLLAVSVTLSALSSALVYYSIVSRGTDEIAALVIAYTFFMVCLDIDVAVSR